MLLPLLLTAISVPSPTGTLVVNSRPASMVFIGDKNVGRTPLKLKRRPGGVRVVLQDTKGKKRTFYKEIQAGQTTRLTYAWPEARRSDLGVKTILSTSKSRRAKKQKHYFKPSAQLPSWGAKAVKRPEVLQSELQILQETKDLERALAIASVLALRAEELGQDGEEIREALDELMRFAGAARLAELHAQLLELEGAPPAKPSQRCEESEHLMPGFLTLGSEPHSEVFKDGIKLGDTPLSKVRLRAGCHELLLVSSDGRTKTFRATVSPNQVTINLVDFASTKK